MPDLTRLVFRLREAGVDTVAVVEEEFRDEARTTGVFAVTDDRIKNRLKRRTTTVDAPERGCYAIPWSDRRLTVSTAGVDASPPHWPAFDLDR